MPKIDYKNTDRHVFRATAVAISQAEKIINEYVNQGFTLTLRQLYYQFVARDIFPENRKWKWTGSRWVRDDDGTKNATPNYKWLGSIINNARLEGMIDWLTIEDRSRNVRSASHWSSPHEIVEACASQFRVDLWEGQDYRCEVWIEKEALAGVIQGVCDRLDVPYFACIGYVSQSEMWRAARRLIDYEVRGKKTIVFHLGDHDPSGIDMTRDIRNRLSMFRSGAEVIRLALNMDQVEKYSPPPNPAKMTDARYLTYVSKYGEESWELDALEPSVLVELIDEAVCGKINGEVRSIQQELQDQSKAQLRRVANKWQDVVDNLEE